MAKICAISDTHNQHRNIVCDSGDILIHAGDATGRGYEYELEDFIDWFAEQDYEHKIYVPGNHDIGLENDLEKYDKRFTDNNIMLLNDESVVLRGISRDNSKEYEIKVHGSPITPNFGRWAFMRARGESINKHWMKIPKDTDILITHGPPNGILDEVDRFGGVEHTGCEMLWERVQSVCPKLHIFGHIHEGAGALRLGDTEYINASQLDEYYVLVNQPTVRNIR